MKTYKQLDAMDCGPTCLQMIADHYGRNFELEFLRNQSYITREGASLLGISEAAEKIGFRTLAVNATYEKLIGEAPFPCILHWNQNHYVVLEHAGNEKRAIGRAIGAVLNSFRRGIDRGIKITIADPAHGKITLDEHTFLKSWMGTNKEGVALLLEPTDSFFTFQSDTQIQQARKGFGFLVQYLRPYRKFIVQLMLSMVIFSALSLMFPFLTQGLVDFGINHQNVGLVTLILTAQLMLFAGMTGIEMIRSWLLLHMNSRINIVIISDFLIKLMKLPIRYFDTKLIGDIKQRIGDHQRIQAFLTGSTLSTLFSFVNLIIFTIVLGVYSLKILGVFAVFSVMGIAWIFLFLKKRKKLDYVRFQNLSDNENVLFEIITGMQEIKLNNCETIKRWGWENVQVKLFKLNVKSLVLGQYQLTGSKVFNQVKNILITYIAARQVIDGSITLGMMMSISYIIGQMNSPIDQILGFIQSAQDAKISLDRLSEIHNRENEEVASERVTVATTGKSITLRNTSFQYLGPRSPHVLKDVDLEIPEGKITAIVGTSGSGKTTLMKLLLKFYEPVIGNILVGNQNLTEISPSWWRSQCGSVMQDGYIFSDTIANNISVGELKPNQNKLRHAVHVANIQDFIDELPLGYNTKIGNAGNGISAGQRQRILIARAVYKNPEYIFFDEATSVLDANNEKIIMQNLEEFYKSKTVVLIAHRLSTVKNADQIVVVEHGSIVEIGNHATLIAQKGKYFELVKNQLELGN